MKISEMNDGTQVYGNFLINECKRCVDNKGSAYLVVTLQDNSGTIEARKWTSTPEDEQVIVKGKVVYINGVVNHYGQNLQLKILECESVNMENLNWADYISSAPFDLEQMRQKLVIYVKSIKDEDLRNLVAALIKSYGKRFYIWPAAVRNHHDYISGLLYHSLTMADMAVKVAEVYPSLDRDILLAGALVHDLGKIIELSGPQGTVFTLEGKLLGHISIGQAELRRKAKELGMFEYDDLPEAEQTPEHPLFHKKELAVLLEHMILSHHNQPDFGSPVRPLTREAFVLAAIDDLDAKMTILDKAYSGVEPGASTVKLFNMDDRYFYKPYYHENPAKPAGTPLEETLKEII